MITKMEIGSEFWEIPTSQQKNSLFPEDTTWFLSGRCALSAIIKDIQKKQVIKSARLPAWCCDSMIYPFLKEGIDVQFYPVYMENGMLKQEIGDHGKSGEILFLMDYFGYRTEVPCSGGDAIMIRDLTHSIFSGMHHDTGYCFGSLRKWAGFYTGGFAWGISGASLQADPLYVDMRRSAMLAKADYINGTSNSKEYLKIFQAAEEYLEHSAPANADERDIQAAQRIDLSFIKEKRRKNAAVLIDALSDMTVFSTLGAEDCPLFVPILVQNGKRDKLRKHLIDNKIYCPVHWPCTDLHHPDKKTMHIYDNELSLVCDQRYDEADMERIVQVIRAF